jgi:hypothetical protein
MVIMGLTKDGYYPTPGANTGLGKVRYCVYTTTGNSTYFSYHKLSDKMSKIAGKELSLYTIPHTKIFPPQYGGGGFEQLSEIWKFFWENKDIIGLGVGVLKWAIKRVITLYQTHQSNRVQNKKLRAVLSLNIQEKKVFDERQAPLINERMVDLVQVGFGIASKLEKMFPMLLFDLEVHVHITPIDLCLVYNLQSERNTQQNRTRLLNKVNKIVAKPGLEQIIQI